MSSDSKWSVVYEGAYKRDGSLFFPEKLNQEVLEAHRKTMGLYKFTNQYLNKTIPDGEQDLKKSWIKYMDQRELGETYTFIFVDPAISTSDTADYTAYVVVDVDKDQNWYVRLAQRQRITATETIDLLFRLNQRYRPMRIGVEQVAYQEAIEHFAKEEMKRRNEFIPLKMIKRSRINTDGEKTKTNSKNFRIRGILVPRFEFGKVFLDHEMDDFILEYSTFPRGRHDDLLDALASIEDIVIYPSKESKKNEPRSPNHPDYEKHFIKKLHKRQKEESEDFY